MEKLRKVRDKGNAKKKSGKPLTLDQYFFAGVGECGIEPTEFWKLTPAETTVIIQGKSIQRSYESANFRMLYTLYYNSKRRKNDPIKKPEQLWGLLIDDLDKNKKGYLTDEELELRRKIRMKWQN